MKEFPAFMRHPANRIASEDQATPGVEGHVFNGADGSQMAFWTCHKTAASAAHTHDYDEYVIVVEGCYTLSVGGERIRLNAGDEYFIPRGTAHAGEVQAGTRTIHCFGGQRVRREMAGPASSPLRDIAGGWGLADRAMTTRGR
jgi:quercetin dioxygenase-like cupin family protein